MFSVETIAFNIALSFAVTQLARFGASVNWDQAKSQADSHMRGLIHNAWLEGNAESSVNAMLDACAVLCQDKDDLKGLITAAQSGDLPAAVKELKAMLLKVLPPHGDLTAQLQPLLAA